ncbi:MAG TPA: hypothetical protein VFS45_00125 [Sphingomicrobium sp.]|nr:hypothetical protein [Sphingomicrobium sp.]
MNHRIIIAALAAAGLGAGPVAAQTRPAPTATQTRPAPTAARPVATAPRPAARVAPAAAQPIPRATFLANMDAEFRKMDSDKNGTATRLEIEQSQRAAGSAQAHNRLRARFAELDTDRNGQLSLAEFGRLLPPPAPPNAAPILSRFDLNRDNNVSLIEYRTGTLANFDRLDADKDGIVSAAEMKAGGIGK